MLRTDKLYQWAPTQMAMAHEPGQVLNDEQIEAAHAATDVGAEDAEPRRQRLPEGSLVVLLPVALLAVIAAVSLLVPYFR